MKRDLLAFDKADHIGLQVILWLSAALVLIGTASRPPGSGSLGGRCRSGTRAM